MNAKDFTEFHTLVEQFEREVSLKDICSQEGVDYRGYMRMCATIREEMKSDPRDSHNVYVFISQKTARRQSESDFAPRGIGECPYAVGESTRTAERRRDVS